MFRPIARLWLVVFVPFAVLPSVFISGWVVPHAALWPHAAFHIVYLPILVTALWVLWLFVRETANLSLRAIAALLLLSQSSAAFGHAGELVAVAQAGLFQAPESIFNQNPHMFFANFALGGIIGSELLLIVLTITAIIQRFLRRSVKSTIGPATRSA